MEKDVKLNRNFRKLPNKFIPRLIVSVIIAAVIGTLVTVIYISVNKKIHNSNTTTAMIDNWKKKDFEKVYQISKAILQDNPFNNSALAYHGYASFVIGQSQIEHSASQRYMDESINCLRRALVDCSPEAEPQLNYMLGQAYFFKNEYSSFIYYSDLAIQYLTKALEQNYKPDPMWLYLGKSYSNVDMHREAVSYLGRALVINDSDFLLLSIAKQYYKLGQSGTATQYLERAKQISETVTENDDIYFESSNLLGRILIEEKKYDEAKKEFLTLLEKNQNFADAHYGLAVIYKNMNDKVGARSELRKCLSINHHHEEANSMLKQL